MPRNPVKGDHDEIEEKPGLQVVSEHKETAQTVVVKAEVGGKCWGRPTFAIFASRQRRQGASSISWVVHPASTRGDFKGPITTHERKGCDLGNHTDPNGIFVERKIEKKQNLKRANQTPCNLIDHLFINGWIMIPSLYE